MISTFWSLLIFPVWCGFLQYRMRHSRRADDSLVLLGFTGIFVSALSWWHRVTGTIRSARFAALVLPALLLRSIHRCRHPKSGAAPHEEDFDECRWCGERRYRLDHHCLWLNACVHAGTHADFLAALALAVLSASAFAATTLSDLATAAAGTPAPNATGLPWPASRAVTGITALHAASPHDFALALCVAVVAAAATALLALHAAAVARNRPARDLCSAAAASAARRRHLNPDAGPAANCHRFWAGRWDLLRPTAAPRGGAAQPEAARRSPSPSRCDAAAGLGPDRL